jgi:hypothetical protein
MLVNRRAMLKLKCTLLLVTGQLASALAKAQAEAVLLAKQWRDPVA